MEDEQDYFDVESTRVRECVQRVLTGTINSNRKARCPETSNTFEFVRFSKR